MIAESDTFNCSKDIIYRTAINRIYYGIFHFVQNFYSIIIPSNEVKRCHAYVKKQIEDMSIIGEYSRLEEFRVDADYGSWKKEFVKNDYKDALLIKNRLISIITGEGDVSYECDEDYFKKYKS